MRGGIVMKKTVVLTILILLLCLVSVFAQKGTGATYWTVKIVGDDSGGATILGGNGTEDEVVYSPLSPGVQVSVAAADSKNMWNRFQLRIDNYNVYASRTYDSLKPWQWISFRNITMLEGAYDPFNSRPYTDNANRLGPEATQSEVVWPIDSPPPQCHADFMNLSPHPRPFYLDVVIHITFSGFSILEMSPSTSILVNANSGISIYPKNDCAEPRDTGIGLALTHLQGEKATVTRLSSNKWQLDMNQSVLLYENGFEVLTQKRGGKTLETCNAYLAGGWWTNPIKYSLIFTRMPY
jgi:hypothetical protein